MSLTEASSKVPPEVTVRVIAAGRDLIIQPYTWTRDAYERGEPRSPVGRAYCAYGALQAASLDIARELGINRSILIDAADQAIMDAIFAKGSNEGTVGYNDLVAKSKRQVIARFNEAIKALTA